jgi:hypothetical protein
MWSESLYKYILVYTSISRFIHEYSSMSSWWYVMVHNGIKQYMAISKNVNNLEIQNEYLMHTSLHTYCYATRVITLVLQCVSWLRRYISIFLLLCVTWGLVTDVLRLYRRASCSCHDITSLGLHKDLSDAEVGSFAAWFWLANVANGLGPTEEQASAGKQEHPQRATVTVLPRVLAVNDINIRKQNPVGGSGLDSWIKTFRTQKRKIEELLVLQSNTN